MPTILITGANRGLGLEFAKQYAEDGWTVYATCRNPDSAKDLRALIQAHPAIQIHALDVTEWSGIERLAARLQDVTIDLLLNNAGIYGNQAGQKLGDLKPDEWLKVFCTNSIAPIKVAEAFLPHISRGSGKKIASISSQMASLANNTSGGSYYYRSSKTALNMALTNLSIDLKPRGITVLALHPGWVRTGMGGPDAPLDAAISVLGLRQVINSATLEQTGTFLSYDDLIPW